MIKQSLLLRCIVLCNILVFAASQQSSHTFLFCLKPELQPLQMPLKRGAIHVELAELDHFFKENDVVRIEPWLKSATELDRDGDIYLNRIYRVYIDQNSTRDINQIISSMETLPFILQAEPEWIRKPYILPNDYNSTNQYSIDDMKVDLAWEYWFADNSIPGGDDILYVSYNSELKPLKSFSG